MKKEVCFGVMFLATSLGFAADAGKVAQVEKGELKEARVSWWGFDEADSTRFLQAAINSRASKVIVDKLEKPWITTTLHLRDNLVLEFEEDAEILAKSGDFKDIHASLVRIEEVRNVTIQGQGGQGGILRMRKKDYQDATQYKKSEWRHNVNIRSSENVTVRNMRLLESGGDGIYVGVKDKNRICTDITISKVICDQHHRQGISVIAAVNLLIEDTVLSNTSGTAPQAGIDFEPNGAHEPLRNCVMRNCTSFNNAGAGYEFYLPNMSEAAAGPFSITLENCTSRNEKQSSLTFTTRSKKPVKNPIAGSLLVKNCTFEEPQGNAVNVNMDCCNDVTLTLSNVKVIGGATKNPRRAPVTISYLAPNKGDNHTKVFFDGLSVKDELPREWFEVNDQSFIGVKNYRISGKVSVEKNGKTEQISLDEAWLAKRFAGRDYVFIPEYECDYRKLAPASETAPAFVPALAQFKQRDNAGFWFYAKAGDKVKLTLNYGKLTTTRGKTASVNLALPSGKSEVWGKIEFPELKDFSLESAPETGVYRVRFNVGGPVGTLEACNVPCGIALPEVGGVHPIYAKGNFYFAVPEKTAKFAVRLNGADAGEGVNAQLYAPDGTMVFSQEDIMTACQYTPEKVQPGVWRLVIAKPNTLRHEDCNINLLGVPPFLALDPAQVIVEK